MEILIGTNHLVEMAGSELICLEMAEYFALKGHRLSLFANVVGEPMAGLFRSRLGLNVVTDPGAIAPFSYDLAYLQHHVTGLFDYSLNATARERTAFVFGKLGRRTFMESGGWAHDRLLADAYFANSDKTAERLRELDVSAPVTTFYNAAPSGFFQPPRTSPRALRKITVITNHLDPTLGQALERLARDVEIERIGRRFIQRRATPDLICGSDLVVSIGKTIPYALAARVPVYVYDHFGGPGYLTADNFARAACFNFSGRCCERKLGAAELAREVVEGYEAGDVFARTIDASVLERYRLEPYLDALLTTPARSNAARMPELSTNPQIRQEQLLAEYLREQWRGAPQRPMRKMRRTTMALTEAFEASRRWSRRMARHAVDQLTRLPQSFSA